LTGQEHVIGRCVWAIALNPSVAVSIFGINKDKQSIA